MRILSPSSADWEQVTKYPLYGCGVREFWVVDHEGHNIKVDVRHLGNPAGATLVGSLLPVLGLVVDEVFRPSVASA